MRKWRRRRTTTHGPGQCKACHIPQFNPDIPPYDEWEPRHQLEYTSHNDYYDRDGNQIGRSMWTWLREASPGYSIIRHTHRGDSLVSTIHLGINHSFTRAGPPIIFETMTFGLDDYQERYICEADAIEGHRHVLTELGWRT